MREAEGEGPIVECFSADNQCRITTNCKLAGILKRSFEVFYAELDRYTLADLASAPHTFDYLLRVVD